MANPAFMNSSYKAVLDFAQNTGQTGTIKASGRADTGVKYGFYPSGGGMGGGGTINTLINKLLSENESAKKANEARYAQALGKYQTIEKMFTPGGDFAKSYAAYLASARKTAVAGGEQALVSSGLYNTTSRAGLGMQWEKEVGAPSMLAFQEKERAQYAGALEKTAGVIERREDEYPDYGMIANLIMKASGG